MHPLIEMLNAKIEGKHLLKHPFYLAWSRGELTLDDLRVYAAPEMQSQDHLPKPGSPPAQPASAKGRLPEWRNHNRGRLKQIPAKRQVTKTEQTKPVVAPVASPIARLQPPLQLPKVKKNAIEPSPNEVSNNPTSKCDYLYIYIDI